MAKEVFIPKLGQTMETATLVRWLVEDGSKAEQGQEILEVETDKAMFTVEATASGILHIGPNKPGDVLPVLSVVAIIGTPEDAFLPVAQQAVADQSISALADTPPDLAPLSAEDRGRIEARGKILASPRARKLARTKGIDLSVVTPSGNGGERIVERDVIAYLNQLRKVTPLAKRIATEAGVDLRGVTGTGPGGRITRRDIESATHVAPSSSAAAMPFSRLQRMVAERMLTSFTSAPHFYLHAEVNARRLLAMRQELLPILEASDGLRVTISDLLILICARALVRHPQAMAQYTPDGLRPASAVNIGLAADTPNGLLVPVIHAVDSLTLTKLVRTRSELIERARAGKSLPQDFDDGVFTISNLGTFRVDSFDAILNPPQAAILAVGRVTERPFAERGQLALVPTMKLSLSVDHRVMDGAAAARFLDNLASLVEDPASILVH